MTETDRQRIDKWLWFARVVKTRALAQTLATSGHVRLNGRKVDAASQAVKPGDVLTIGMGGHVKVLKVVSFAARRGSYPEAVTLYEDLSPAPVRREEASEDDGSDGKAGDEAESGVMAGVSPRAVRGEGRPTKRDRRRFVRFADEG